MHKDFLILPAQWIHITTNTRPRVTIFAAAQMDMAVDITPREEAADARPAISAKALYVRTVAVNVAAEILSPAVKEVERERQKKKKKFNRAKSYQHKEAYDMRYALGTWRGFALSRLTCRGA